MNGISIEFYLAVRWTIDDKRKMIDGNYGYSKKEKNRQENWLSKYIEDKLQLIKSFDAVMGLGILKRRRIYPKNLEVLKNKITEMFPNCQDMRRLIALTFADLLKGFSGLYIL